MMVFIRIICFAFRSSTNTTGLKTDGTDGTDGNGL